MASPDPDIRWIMRENLRKSRLTRLQPRWAQQWSRILSRKP
jgi:hypothetical protein